jgi:hypothetical protein
MVNNGMVNANSLYFPQHTFCEIFAVLGRFLRLKNPVKYIRRIEISYKWAHPAQAGDLWR